MTISNNHVTPFRMIALAIVGVAVVGTALYFSFRDLQKDDKGISPSAPVTQRPAPEPPPVQPSIPQPVIESIPGSTVAETVPVAEAPPAVDVAPPVGSEAPVPAVFGLLADSNVTNLPFADGLQGIAEEFAEKVKQGGWDTTSEAYRANWEKAAQEADDILRARYGTEVYMKLKQNAAP